MAALKRIKKELEDFNKPENATTYFTLKLKDDNNYFELEAIMEGPSETPYAGGKFYLDIILPSDYPFKPPKITFRTKIYHLNIHDGNICVCHLCILKEQWSPALKISTVLQVIRELMIEPYEDLCFSGEVYNEYTKNREKYNATAVEWTNLYAK